MKRKSNDIRIDEALNELVNEYNLEAKLLEVKLMEAWKSKLSPMISKHTKSLRIQGKSLIVQLDSAMLRSELSYQKSKLVDRLNEEVGAVVIDNIVLS